MLPRPTAARRPLGGTSGLGPADLFPLTARGEGCGHLMPLRAAGYKPLPTSAGPSHAPGDLHVWVTRPRLTLGFLPARHSPPNGAFWSCCNTLPVPHGTADRPSPESRAPRGVLVMAVGWGGPAGEGTGLEQGTGRACFNCPGAIWEFPSGASKNTTERGLECRRRPVLCDAEGGWGC